MKDIYYEFEDFSSYVLNIKAFKERFVLIDIVKSCSNRAAFIVNDIKNNSVCFLKAKTIGKNSKNEIDVYTTLMKNKHGNIVEVYDIILVDKLYFIVKQYIHGDNLAEHKSKNKTLIMEDMISQLSNGINHIHKLNIIHGDIKLENVMVSNNNIKIVDFDLARIMVDNYIMAEHTYGTKNYIAPESFDLNMYSKKTDLWSLGILLYKYITNKFPYVIQPDRMQHFYVKNYFKKLDLTELDKYSSIYDSHVINTIKKLLEFDDTKRIIINNN